MEESGASSAEEQTACRERLELASRQLRVGVGSR